MAGKDTPSPPLRNGLSGRHSKKVKTGCKTCRMRKIKCDEARPSCRKCVSTDRHCEGYGIWGDAKDLSITRTASETTALTPVDGTACSIASTPKRVHGTAFEKLYFTWFARRTAFKLPGIFKSGFWDSLVVQASLDEPAVLHAALVLGSAHIGDIKNKWPLLKDHAMKREHFMLQQYSAAIGQLHPHLRREDPCSMRVVLIACLLFACAELLRDRLSMAWIHLCGGAQALAELQRHPSSRSDPSHTALSEAFLKLRVQFYALGQYDLQCPLLCEEDVALGNVPYAGLCSTQYARRDLDILLQAVQRLSKRGTSYRLDDSTKIPASLLSQQDKLRRLLAGRILWIRTACKDCQGLSSPEAWVSYLILEMYFTMVYIENDICLRLATEETLGMHTSSFLSIIERACEMWNALASGDLQRRKYGDEQEHGSSVMDIGWILPLYFTAINCRQHPIRLQAIRMVGLPAHREGVWDAAQAALVARRIMQIEEERAKEVPIEQDDFDTFSAPDKRSLMWPLLPDEHWVHEVKMMMTDGDSDQVRVLYKTRQDGGGWVEHMTCLDRITNTWT